MIIFSCHHKRPSEGDVRFMVSETYAAPEVGSYHEHGNYSTIPAFQAVRLKSVVAHTPPLILIKTNFLSNLGGGTKLVEKSDVKVPF